MNNELLVLLGMAASLGFIHTLLGPDHYLPFIVLSRARNWSQRKTMWITFISGVGHVAGSVILGIIGIAMGLAANRIDEATNRMTEIEAGRGGLVGWMLIAFGLMYTVYGLYKYFKKGAHVHLPAFLRPKSIRHKDLHIDAEELEKEDSAGRLTPWILFLIFVFGPCEVLIPTLMVPAAKLNAVGIALVALVFGIATVGTMMTVVFLGYKGLSMVQLKGREYVFHLLAGVIILLAGAGMQFMGL